MTEKSLSNRSLLDLSHEQLRAIEEGDVSRAHECAGAAAPWPLYNIALRVEGEKAGVRLTFLDEVSARSLHPLGTTKETRGGRFVEMEPLQALELCGDDRMTPEAVEAVLGVLDRAADWVRLSAVFDWLAKTRTERIDSLDQMADTEIAALAAASFEHWKPYPAPRHRLDAFARYLESVGRANAAWLAERQEAARQAIADAKVERERQEQRESIARELRPEIAAEVEPRIRAKARAELLADEDLRDQVRQELMALVDPEPGAFEAMLQWLDARLATDERRATDGGADADAFLARLNAFRLVRDALVHDRPTVATAASAPPGWWAVNEYRDGKLIRTLSTHRDRTDANVDCDRAKAAGRASVLVEPVEHTARLMTSRAGGTVGTDQGTGRLVDVIRDIDHVLHDLDQIAAETERTALAVLRDHDGATDERAAGFDDQLLTLLRLAVERWTK